MWTNTSQIVEITGIMGAGYLPGLLAELRAQLNDSYQRLGPHGVRTPLKAMYMVDNTAMRKANPKGRLAIKRLIHDASAVVPDLSVVMRATQSLDTAFWEAVDDWNEPVDIAMRRGGLLHACQRVTNPKWRQAMFDSAKLPKLMIFLRADEEVIADSFAHNAELKQVLKREPDVYNATAEAAFEQQEEWIRAIQNLPGLITIARSVSSKREFVTGLIPQIQGPLGTFGCSIVAKMNAFISHSAKDKSFADKLYADLKAHGIDCWYAPENMAIGEKIVDAIDEAIEIQNKVILVLSKDSILSDRVEDEVMKALAEERVRGYPVLFPIRLDDAVMKTSEPWAKLLRDQRHIGDFRSWSDHGAYQESLQRVLRDLAE